jgi:hypothetical protein
VLDFIDQVVTDTLCISGYHSDFQTFKSKIFQIVLDDID